MIDTARLRITLFDLDPAPWRELDIPLSMTFKSLHDTIQAAFLWFDCHLWEFEFAGRRYGLPFDDEYGDEKIYNANTTRLTRLLNSNVSEFLYIYDMGDYWQHHIKVIDLFDAKKGSRYPQFVGGKWRTPPEDVGGAPGFEMFLAALADPDHEEHKELLEWYGGPFDHDDIRQDVVKAQIKRIANMRRVKK